MARGAMRGRSYYPEFRDIPTRWGDNDVYGHVNNVVYYAWFDTAVNLWLIDAGLLDIEKSPIIGLVVETGCTYARPIAFPSTVSVGLSAAHVGRSSVRYEMGIFDRGSDTPAAEGFFVHVYVDRVGMRPSPLSDAMRDALRRIAPGETA